MTSSAVPATDASAPADAPSLADDPVALRAAEDAALLERRRIALGDAAPAHPDQLKLPRVGLALSGGGVRSATFALGLMRGLAQSRSDDHPGPTDPARRTLVSEGLLGRIDYLSTVSGGGYIGGMFGRLVSTYGLACAQRLMASSDSPVLQWLRRNGRYLTPSGSRDIGIAAVTYLRAWLAIHAEFMFACLFLGLLVVLPHLFQHTWQLLRPQGWERWQTPWWPVAVSFWALLAPGLITGYWAARDAPDAMSGRPPWRDVVFLAVLALVACGLLLYLHDSNAINLQRDSLCWPTTAVFALVSAVFGQGLAQGHLAVSRAPYTLTVARLRNRLTRALRVVTLVAVAIAGLGVLDRLTWWVLEELQGGNEWLWGGVGFGGLVVLVLRTLMQPLQRMAAEAGAHARDWLPRLINLASLAGLLALVMAWLVLLQWFVFAPETFEALRNWPAWMRAGLLGLVGVLWVGLTAGNVQMANTSSLHSFYRARLTRAYLAVGNRARRLDGKHSHRADVTVVVEGDDTALDRYRPETSGGPIHLVSTCLNQTRDDQSGLYNADRKGTAVIATWRGLEVGTDDFIAHRPGHDAGTLGRWVAVSGAASSPGAGSYTSRGLALLVYFLGVRLGHWVRAPRKTAPLRWLSHLGWRFMPKPLMLTSEASATFFGTERPWWYLSDGGHFDNTGVYALLKRELEFIILSDASCDGVYAFADIENLVRKARIDFGAEIDFYTREEAARLFSLAGTDLTVLSPEDMTDNHSSRGVLLARIRYRERPGPRGADGHATRSWRPEGTLLVVKPNLHDGLDVDLLAYAQQHNDFPHESTGDQSFDEAQWESYHRLGEDFGRALHDTWLAQLPGWRSPARHALRVAARLGGSKLPDAPKVAPLWRRSARATAIGTTLGLGASGTLLLSIWQVQEQLQRNKADQQAEARQLFGEVSKGLQKLDPGCPDLSEILVTQTSLLLDLRGSKALRPLESEGLERLATRLGEACSQRPTSSEACVISYNRMQSDLCTLVQKPDTQGVALNYWHPGTSPGDQARAASSLWAGWSMWLRSAGALRMGAAPPMSAPIQVVPPTASPAATPPLPARAPVPSPAGAAWPSLAACDRAGATVNVYLHIYDESSRVAAAALRQRLQDAALASGARLQVAPIENVGRTSALRQQRRPVSWAQPTFVVHNPPARGCAVAMSRLVGPPWVMPGQTDQVWVRDLPDTLKGRAGTIELWLPPVEPLGMAESKP